MGTQIVHIVCLYEAEFNQKGTFFYLEYRQLGLIVFMERKGCFCHVNTWHLGQSILIVFTLQCVIEAMFLLYITIGCNDYLINQLCNCVLINL